MCIIAIVVTHQCAIHGFRTTSALHAPSERISQNRPDKSTNNKWGMIRQQQFDNSIKVCNYICCFTYQSNNTMKRSRVMFLVAVVAVVVNVAIHVVLNYYISQDNTKHS